MYKISKASYHKTDFRNTLQSSTSWLLFFYYFSNTNIYKIECTINYMDHAAICRAQFNINVSNAKKDISSMPCSLVSAPPTLNTLTATHAIQPTFSINEIDYKVNVFIEYSIYFSLYRTSLLE